MSVHSRSVSNTGYNERDAKYEPFIAFTSRFKSFVSWPHASALQSARNMALAGFFYMGSSDRARCFYCGLTLRDWDGSDDPFRSHRQWSPNCAYISTIAEQQLNSGFQSLRVSDNRVTSSTGHTSATSGPSDVLVTDSATCSDAQSNQIPSPWSTTHQSALYEASVSVDCPDEGLGLENTMPEASKVPPHVEAVLEMGYSMDDVERTMDRRRERGNGEFTSASSLMAAIEGWDCAS